MRKELKEYIKKGLVKRFYNSSDWKITRIQALNRDNNECQRCKAEGKFSRAESVHHIKHLKARPDLALELTNLVSLCNECHNLEHPEKIEIITANKKDRLETTERW